MVQHELPSREEDYLFLKVDPILIEFEAIKTVATLHEDLAEQFQPGGKRFLDLQQGNAHVDILAERAKVYNVRDISRSQLSDFIRQHASLLREVRWSGLGLSVWINTCPVHIPTTS